MQTLFADTISNIAVTGPLVRIEFAATVLTQNAEGKQDARLVPNQQIVLPLEGFVRSVGIQEQIVRRLIADGVIKTQPATGAAPVAATTS